MLAVITALPKTLTVLVVHVGSSAVAVGLTGTAVLVHCENFLSLVSPTRFTDLSQRRYTCLGMATWKLE